MLKKIVIIFISLFISLFLIEIALRLSGRLYHKFWAKVGRGKVLIGEVSSVNDDRVDNKFLNQIGRFSEIEEDEKPLYLLYNDYKNFIQI